MERRASERRTAAADSGRIEGIEVAELLWDLGTESYTGSVIFERDEVRKILYFRDGRVVFAASTEIEDRLGHFLLKRGEVRLPPLIDAGSEVARGRRLGQILIDRGTMDPAALVRAVMDQVREIALSVFPWRGGTWRLSKAKLPADESITLDLPMGDLVLAGVRRVRGWSRIRSAVGGSRAVYERTESSVPDYASFGMTERAILERLEGAARVDSLCRDVYAPSYAVYRALWALSILGLVRRLDPHPVQESLAGPGEGLIGALGVSDLLLDLGDREFTGVLRLFHPSGMEGALHLARGRVEFATTSDMELSLSGHLLRRGIISEQDHEQAERLLISGKRLGTILAESGALSEDELVRFVREQVLEVACQLLCWREGEYRIEESLPSEESITLTLPVEDAVMSAHETSESFARVWEGVGGLKSAYRLEPDYLERLDRMTLRPAVWEIVTLLSEERTIEELLAIRTEPDFEVCRLVHALERTRVIARVPAEATRQDPVEGVFARGDTPHELIDSDEGERAGVEPGEAHVAVTEEDETASRIAPELFASAPVSSPPSFDSFESGDDAVEEAEPGHEEPEAAEAEGDADAPPDLLEVLAERAPEPELCAEPDKLLEQGFEPAADPPDDSVAELEPEPPAEPFVGRETLRIDRTDLASILTPPGESTLEETHSEESQRRESEPEEAPKLEDEPAPEEPVAMQDGNAGDEEERDARAEPPRDDDAGAPVVEGPWELESPGRADVDSGGEEPEALDEDRDRDERGDDALPSASEVETTLEMPAPPAFELDEPGAVPDAIREAVARFNRRHSALYARLKQEVGSGAVNFVRTCRSSLGPSASLFEDFEPDREGLFDAAVLEKRLVDAGAEEDAFERLDALIAEELAMMRYLFNASRLEAVESELADL